MKAQAEVAHSRMHKIQQLIKWTVYTLLIVNGVGYFFEDWNRIAHSISETATFLDWTAEFATSIDEAAWFLLLFMFELETYAVSDQAWSRKLERVIHGARLVAYAMIAHTIFAYTDEIVDLYPTVQVEGVTDLCMLADQDISFVFNLEYTAIDAENCASLSSDTEFFWRTYTKIVVTDARGLELERRLAWVDIIEAWVWLLILLAIEIVVRMQNRGISGGPVMATANGIKMFLYLILFAAAAYWATLSHWLYVWDELLWIGGFAAIEMNMSEWRDEIRDEQGQASSASGIQNVEDLGGGLDAGEVGPGGRS